jgi:hypothetical protein
VCAYRRALARVLLERQQVRGNQRACHRQMP